MIEQTQLGKIASIFSGGTPSRSKSNYWNGNIPWVKTTQIQNCIITENDIDEWITEEGLKNSSAKMVTEGTILMAMYGQGKTRGQVAILNIDAAINQACAAIKINSTLNNNYVYQQLLFKYKSIRNLSNTGSQENLSLGLIKRIYIYLPPLPEQKAIASLLSVWDEAIEKTERLIEAKERKIKYLQRKLFNEIEKHNNVEYKKLKEIAVVTKGEQINKTNMIEGGGYYVLNGGIFPSGYLNKWNTIEGTISISEGGNSCGFVNFNKEKFWAGGHCYTLRNLSDKIFNEFLFFYLKYNQEKIMRLRVGSGLPNIQKRDIENLKILLPELKLQKYVTTIFRNAKLEIEILKKLNEKYKTQKHGLMQKLLTGRWRVKINKL